MTSQKDPLLDAKDPDRVYYATGVLLDADDFNAEQVYHRARLARALAHVTGSGTVAGLWVQYKPGAAPSSENPSGTDDELEVYPGMAIDRLGRIIEVPRKACLRLNRWYQSLTPDQRLEAFHPRTPPLDGDPYVGVVVDLFLSFRPCERGKTPAFAAGPYEALDAVTPSRIRDGYELQLVIRPEDTPSYPVVRWPDPATASSPEDWRHDVQDMIFNAWDGRLNTQPAPEPPEEYPLELEDKHAVFLARVQIATTGAPATIPTDTRGATVTIENYKRLFIYRTRALAGQSTGGL